MACYLVSFTEKVDAHGAQVVDEANPAEQGT
jgi:hypothetical protein